MLKNSLHCKQPPLCGGSVKRGWQPVAFPYKTVKLLELQKTWGWDRTLQNLHCIFQTPVLRQKRARLMPGYQISPNPHRVRIFLPQSGGFHLVAQVKSSQETALDSGAWGPFVSRTSAPQARQPSHRCECTRLCYHCPNAKDTGAPLYRGLCNQQYC